MEISVAHAARELGLDPSRVRQLARAGALHGRRVGTTWLLDHDAVAQRARAKFPAGRPLSAPRAWGAIGLLAGNRPDHLSASARGQIGALLARRVGDGADYWSALMRNLARENEMLVHSSVLSRVLASPFTYDAALPADKLGLVVLKPVPSVFVVEDGWNVLGSQLGIEPTSITGPERLRILVVPDVACRLLHDDELRDIASVARATGDRDPRARDAAADFLNHLAERMVRP